MSFQKTSQLQFFFTMKTLSDTSVQNKRKQKRWKKIGKLKMYPFLHPT